MASDIAFEQIQDNYWYGAYGPFRVVMMKSNGYINATKLCTSGGKDYKDWARLKGSTELINALEKVKELENTPVNSSNPDFTLRDANVQICTLASPPCIFIKTANNSPIEQLISGTYCHPDLVPTIAGWVSRYFQIMANRVLNGYITAKYKTHIAAAKQELSTTQLALQQATELRIAADMATFRAQQQTQLSMSQTELVLRLNEHVKQQTRMKQEVIEQKEHQHQVWASTHAFTMLRLNNPDAKRPYYALRRKRIDMCGAIMKLRAKHPAAVMVYQNSYVPNPVNLYNRLKSCGILQFNRNFCSSLVGEADLIAKLGDLCTIIKQ